MHPHHDQIAAAPAGPVEDFGEGFSDRDLNADVLSGRGGLGRELRPKQRIRPLPKTFGDLLRQASVHHVKHREASVELRCQADRSGEGRLRR